MGDADESEGGKCTLIPGPKIHTEVHKSKNSEKWKAAEEDELEFLVQERAACKRGKDFSREKGLNSGASLQEEDSGVPKCVVLRKLGQKSKTPKVEALEKKMDKSSKRNQRVDEERSTKADENVLCVFAVSNQSGSDSGKHASVPDPKS